MNRNDIIAYLKSIIPDYSRETNLNKHILQFSIHVFPFLQKGRLHPFIENLVNALVEIEQAVPGYAKITIDKIASYNKSNFEQVIQTLGEIIVLRKVASVAVPDSITLEPSALPNGKNPEFRAMVDDTFFAIEVKTASLFEFSTERQTGLQITAQFNNLDYDLLKQTGKIVNSRSLKVKDYLVSAEEKFEQYKQKEEFKNDLRLLFIIWDDYINEPFSALANPNCGLLTDNSFLTDTRFENVDGVILVRHIHQFFRNLQYGEIVDYGVKKGFNDSFDYDNPAVFAAYVQNPLGRFISMKKVEKFSALPIEVTTQIPVAEYQPTDFIDWQRGISVSGIYTLPEKLRNKVISFFIEKPPSEIPLSYQDISLFDNFSLDTTYAQLVEEYSTEKEIEDQLFEDINVLMKVRYGPSEENASYIRDEAKRRSDRNEYLKSILVQNLSLNSNEECPCCSGKLYSNCCQNNLKFFQYTHYYDL